MRAILAIFLGIAVTAVICMIWQELGILVIASIICTGGISLLVWLPLWWLVGITIIAVFSLIDSLPNSQAVGNGDSPIRKEQPLGQPAEQRKAPSSSASKPRTVEPEQVRLQKYIRRMQGEFHHSREDITQRLLEKGWSSQTIDEAYQGVSPEVTRD